MMIIGNDDWHYAAMQHRIALSPPTPQGLDSARTLWLWAFFCPGRKQYLACDQRHVAIARVIVNPDWWQ